MRWLHALTRAYAAFETVRTMATVNYSRAVCSIPVYCPGYLFLDLAGHACDEARDRSTVCQNAQPSGLVAPDYW
jgi:hypothetical protein